ncbi:serine hydrolase domain-containing protein [Erythrobacter ramosus]|nr:serine hydrolase domain-containing protein [Erythrobacter ramosus]
MAFLAAISSLAGTASAAPRENPEPAKFAEAWRDLSDAVSRGATEQRVVGGTIAFRANGKTLGTSSFGYADLQAGRVATADTLYHWASMTKMVTAVALLQLRDAGKLSLDDPIVKYLPELRAVHDPYGPIDQITLKMLLNHSSGFRSPTFPWGGNKPWHPREPAEWSQVAAMMPYSEIEFEPGTKYGYSNPGMSFLGRVIEIVSGENYQQYVEKHVLWPLDMRKTYFDLTPPYLLPLRSNNYLIENGVRTAQGLDFSTGATVANGGLNGPIDDMLRWADFLLGVNDNGRYDLVLSRQTLEQMWQPVHPTDKWTPQFGESMGQMFFVIDDRPSEEQIPVRYIGHTGSQLGFECFLYIDPISKTAAVAAWNTRPLDSDRVVLRDVRRGFFDRVFPLFRTVP